MELLHKFNQYIFSEKLFHRSDKLLLAVSGGVDSAVLCELCKQAGFDFSIAHCNFQLRGEESDRDEAFVASLAKKYGVEFYIKKFETEAYSKTNKISIQVAARDLRYTWFAELLQSPHPHIRKYSYLLTAHHSNDNIETLLMNFFKGTGIAGLHGIRPKHKNIVRPLLFAKKDELLEFAKENDLQFVEDSSNQSDKYTRNYIRNQLMPLLKNMFPEVEHNLANNITRFRDIELIYEESVLREKKKLIVQKGNEIHIPVRRLLKTTASGTYFYEIIKEFGFSASQLPSAIEILYAQSGKFLNSSTHRLLKDREWIIITPIDHKDSENISIEESHKSIQYPGGMIILSLKEPCNIDADPSVAYLDAHIISYPLLLRKWRQGDYFYPLGMEKKKKLSRFFIDQKMSIAEKERTWVIEMNKKIVWVVGKRIDNRFKVTGKTKKMLILRCQTS